MSDKGFKNQEIITKEENGKPSVEIIYEGPTQPEERVQMNDELEKTEEEAAEDEDGEIKPAFAGSFAPRINYFMNLALKEAKKAAKEGEVPIGAVIVKGNKVISKAHNKKEALKDPTAHAEILAIRKASERLDNWRLKDCELFVTVEPCAMCMGAILQSGIKKLIFGSNEPEFGAVESKIELSKSYPSSLEIYSGFLGEETQKLLTDFFKIRRK